MFGIFRYILALLVAFGHIQFQFQGRWNWTGLYSVFGFFLLSGFLMTRVLHQTYGYSPRGFVAYVANRALRIYPAYWAALAISILALVWFPDFPGQAKDVFHLPASTVEWLLSFVIVGVDRDFVPRVVPTSWSLHIELIFYVLIGLGLSRARWTTALWVTAAVGWTAWAVAHGVPFADRFSTLIAASLPFALGAGLHFVRGSVPRWLLCVACVMFAVNTLAAPILWGDPQASTGFYLSLALVLLIVAGLRDIRPTGRLAIWDRRLGDLSYPIFLIHSQVGYFFAWRQWADNGTFPLFLVSLPALHLIAAAIHFAVVAPIESLRGRVRSRVAERTAKAAAAARAESRAEPISARRSTTPARATQIRVAAALFGVTMSLLIGAVAAEGLLRLAKAMTPPPKPQPVPLDTVGLPSVEGLFNLAKPNQRSMYRGALYTTNSLGMRGPEVTMPKPADTYRIAVLGDSYAMGSGVRYEEAFPELAARLLGKTPDGRRVEPLNLALAGLPLTSIVQSRLPIALKLDPDMLVYAWVINDLEGPNYIHTLAPYQPPGPSLLLNLLRERWKYLRDIFWPARSSYLGELDVNFFQNPKAWAEFGAGLDRLARVGQARHVCVVLFPQTEMQILSSYHPYTRFYDAVIKAARERGIYVVESFPGFLGKDPVDLRCGPLDWHPNAKAHAILADELAKGLKQLPESCWSHRSTAMPEATP